MLRKVRGVFVCSGCSLLRVLLALPTILNERAASLSPRTRNISGISVLFARTEVKMRRFLKTFNMRLYDSVLLLMQNDDRVCVYITESS